MKQAFDVIFCDDYLVGINKTARILTHPVRGEKNTLVSLLGKEFKEIFPCHRLDRETTGVMVFARNSAARNQLMRQFKERKVEKEYLAFARGSLRPGKGKLCGEIIDDQGSKFREKKKKALTLYEVLKDFRDFTFLKLKPLTGRTNQLRIQLALKGHPILGERKYAFGRDFKVNFRRLALHAASLSFRHPLTGNKIELKSPLPKDMEDFLKEKVSLQSRA